MVGDSLAISGRFLVAIHNRLEWVRWYRSSGASQRCCEYLQIELADNPTNTTGDDLAAAADALALVVRQLGLGNTAAHAALDDALRRL